MTSLRIVTVGLAISALAGHCLANTLTVVNILPYTAFVQVFYVGSSTPIQSFDMVRYYGGFTLSGLSNRPIFVRCYCYNTNRWDQSQAFSWKNPSQTGILYIRPSNDFLRPIPVNMQ